MSGHLPPHADAVLDDPPSLYISLFRGLEPNHLGEVSLPAVQRLLLTSKLPASTLERVSWLRCSQLTPDPRLDGA